MGDLRKAGITSMSDRWVRMHVISEKLGGLATEKKSLPGADCIILGRSAVLKHGTIKLVEAKTKEARNQLWVEVTVSGTMSDPSGIAGKTGLHFWKCNAARHRSG